MTNPAKAKGDRAELEIAKMLEELLGFRIRRKLGAGRADDTGDLHGIPDTVVQVAAWSDALRAIREKPLAADTQALNDDATFASTAVRLRGGTWRVVLTPEQYATYVLNSQPSKENK